MSDIRRLVLLRHGRTAWNAERRFQGQADTDLDEVGVGQAADVAPLIAAMQPDLVLSSDLTRARRTAEAVALHTGVAVAVDPRLRERHLGKWQGLTRDEVEQRFPGETALWLAGRDVTTRGGESRDEVAARALSLVHELPDVPLVVLVTHGATAMCLSLALLGLPQSPSVLGPLANCHWTELHHEVGVHERGEWRLRAHNAGAPGPVIPMVMPEQESADATA